MVRGEKDAFGWPLADVAVVLELAPDGNCKIAAVILGDRRSYRSRLIPFRRFAFIFLGGCVLRFENRLCRFGNRPDLPKSFSLGFHNRLQLANDWVWYGPARGLSIERQLKQSVQLSCLGFMPMLRSPCPTEKAIDVRRLKRHCALR